MKRPFQYARKDGLIEEFILDPHYRVFEDGSIETLRDRGGHLKEAWRRCDFLCQTNGYRRVRYRNIQLAAHRIIYRAFLGKLDPHMHVNHIDGNKANNGVSNLELITPAENIRHMYDVLGVPGVKGNCKISQETADKIRDFAARGYTYSRLCLKFGLSKSSISYIVNRKTWVDSSTEGESA